MFQVAGLRPRGRVSSAMSWRRFRVEQPPTTHQEGTTVWPQRRPCHIHAALCICITKTGTTSTWLRQQSLSQRKREASWWYPSLSNQDVTAFGRRVPPGHPLLHCSLFTFELPGRYFDRLVHIHSSRLCGFVTVFLIFAASLEL